MRWTQSRRGVTSKDTHHGSEKATIGVHRSISAESESTVSVMIGQYVQRATYFEAGFAFCAIKPDKHAAMTDTRLFSIIWPAFDGVKAAAFNEKENRASFSRAGHAKVSVSRILGRVLH